jgi:alpha-D-ribose 1-methylphosphonate 5-triphosphate synthase subunit PhnG
MLQSVVTPAALDSTPKTPTERAAWIALLARSPLALLESALADEAQAPFQWMRKPETGLMMVQGRAGGAGERFNAGEITVTRCVLRWTRPAAPDAAVQSQVGVAYVLGRSHRHAQLAALADALLQDPQTSAERASALLEPIRTHITERQQHRHAAAQSTRVDFFTVAREAGAGDDTEAGDE